MKANNIRFLEDDNAVSEVIGEVLLIAIAVIAFSFVALVVFSYADSHAMVHADIQGWMDAASDTVYLRHAGGQTIDISTTRILLHVNGSAREISPKSLQTLKGGNVWQLGELIRINTSSLWNEDINEYSEVSLTILDTDSGLVIRSGTLQSGTHLLPSANVTPPTPPGPFEPPQLGLNELAWWGLDEKDGAVAYDYMINRDGMIYGKPMRIEGVIGNALRFDGMDDYVRIDDTTITSYPFSVSLWLRTESTSRQSVFIMQPIKAMDAEYAIYIDNKGNVEQVAKNKAIESLTGSKVNDGKWHHVVAVFYSSETMTLYVDNPEKPEERVLSKVIFFKPDIISFGTSNNKLYFKGELDDIRLYDRALSSDDVKTLYSSGKV